MSRNSNSHGNGGGKDHRNKGSYGWPGHSGFGFGGWGGGIRYITCNTQLSPCDFCSIILPNSFVCQVVLPSRCQGPIGCQPYKIQNCGCSKIEVISIPDVFPVVSPITPNQCGGFSPFVANPWTVSVGDGCNGQVFCLEPGQTGCFIYDFCNCCWNFNLVDSCPPVSNPCGGCGGIIGSCGCSPCGPCGPFISPTWPVTGFPMGCGSPFFGSPYGGFGFPQ